MRTGLLWVYVVPDIAVNIASSCYERFSAKILGRLYGLTNTIHACSFRFPNGFSAHWREQISNLLSLILIVNRNSYRRDLRVSIVAAYKRIDLWPHAIAPYLNYLITLLLFLSNFTQWAKIIWYNIVYTGCSILHTYLRGRAPRWVYTILCCFLRWFIAVCVLVIQI